MFTALHITALVSELGRRFVPGRLVKTEFYRKKRAVYLTAETEKESLALGFVFHPAGSGCFLVPASKLDLGTDEKPWPVFGIREADVTEVRQVGLDRIFELGIVHEGEARRLMFEALGPNGNIWLLDSSGRRLAVLRDREFTVGQPYDPPEALSMADPFQATADTVHDALKRHAEGPAWQAVRKSFYGFNETLAREALARAGAAGRNDACDRAEKAAEVIRDLAQRFLTAESGYLYHIKGLGEVYPFKLTAVETAPGKFKSLSLAVMAMIQQGQTVKEEITEEKAIVRAVDRAVKKAEKLVANVESDLARAADYEKFKLWGDLLQLNRERLRKGMSWIEVADIVTGSGRPVTIELNPAETPHENIDDYFRRFRKGREGRQLLKRRLQVANEELEALRRIQGELESDFESARKRYEAELAGLMPRTGEAKAVAPRLPYKTATLSTGVTVLIGRDGSDNDRTTFDFARPYELWFHAQQCAGSHVVMRFPNKSFAPSRREIEETAAIAAWHSKARNDRLVPVVYTERRFVRKPRKAKPGLVLVEREKSIIIAPRKPDKPSN